MRISRVVIRNFRSFEHLDVPLSAGTTCLIGENNTGKSNFLHAIRLCIDAGLSSTYRSLLPTDIHSTVDISDPNQVLIGLEITDFQGKINEEALVGAWQCKPGLARLAYRYRPKLSVREDLEAEEVEPGNLTHEDYHWEITGGGDPADDLAKVEWNQDVGSSIRFADLQSFLVFFLPALRDVEADLRQFRNSPLARLIAAMEIDPAEQEQLLDALRQANQQIAAAPTTGAIANAVDASFKSVTGPAFSMDVALGLAEPSFQAIVRAMRILLTSTAMTNFDPSSNGLGLNNILYVSILIEYFNRRLAQQKSAGQIILFEEPEAHLHPQLQLTLFMALNALPFQSILTTHSTHITAHAPLGSYVVLTQTGTPAIASSVPVDDAELEASEILDLERYLDATRSNLLFARKVMLVEGPAEIFLIPALLKQVKGIDLDREGISVIPIYGVHFDAYAKLFSADALPKKCAIITDGDLKPSDADPSIEGEDDLPAPPDLNALENDYVRVFACATTLERAITLAGTLEMFARAADDIGAPTIAARLRDGIAALAAAQDADERREILVPLRESVLNTAKRFGKARFAQIASRHVDAATSIPKYIADAAEWLTEPMRLTNEQREAVRCDEDVMLTACPGSGKTRVIISKLSRAIDAVRDTPRAVACITYTNAAVHEIETRLRHHLQPGDDIYFDICTIHSFCLNHVFRPFCHLIRGYKRGFRVLTPESAEFEEHVTAVLAEHGRYNPSFSDFEDFSQLRVSLDGHPVGHPIEHGGLTREIATAFWKRVREAGFIDFANIIYYSFVLLQKRPEILSYVSAKFAWILVDEFQDTTDLQVEILSLIAATKRTRFLLVGDPCQSIFGFAGARPDLADEFAGRIGARTDLTLSGNFRSSPPIVGHANLLYPRTPVMMAVGPAKKFNEAPEWQHGASAFEVITDYFLPAIDALGIPVGEAAILAPTWFSLFHLGRRLREYGVSIVGPGARPYKRNQQFAPLAEQVCGYMMEPQPEAIAGIERTLFNTILEVTGRASFDIFSYPGRVTVFRLLHKAQELHVAHLGAIECLEAAANTFAAVLIDEEYLSRAEEDLFAMSVEEMKTDMRNNRVDLANLTIDDLGIYASPDAALKLSTLHNAKGREYHAVAMMDLHEGRIPFYQAETAEEFEEAKRLFYVGVTRAKRFLLYLTDNSHPRNQPSRFLGAGGVGVC